MTEIDSARYREMAAVIRSALTRLDPLFDYPARREVAMIARIAGKALTLTSGERLHFYHLAGLDTHGGAPRHQHTMDERI